MPKATWGFLSPRPGFSQPTCTTSLLSISQHLWSSGLEEGLLLDIRQLAKEQGQSQHAQSVTQSLLMERICCSSREQPARIKRELKPCPGAFGQWFKLYIYMCVNIYVYIYFLFVMQSRWWTGYNGWWWGYELSSDLCKFNSWGQGEALMKAFHNSMKRQEVRRDLWEGQQSLDRHQHRAGSDQLLPSLTQAPCSLTSLQLLYQHHHHHHSFLPPQFSSVQLLSPVRLFATPWIAACQASLSIINSQSLLKLMYIQLVMPSHPLSSPSPPTFNLSSIRVSSNESVLHIWWPKYWSFSFSISISNEYSGLISFRIDWFDLLVVQGTLRSLLQQILKWVAFPYFRGSSQPRNRAQVSHEGRFFTSWATREAQEYWSG